MLHVPSPHAEAAREAKRKSAEAIGITPEFVQQLVARFYEKVQADSVLGPVFASRVEDWPVHLARMQAFWESVLHQSGGFRGNPMLKHIAIPGIERAEFERWLQLFTQTLAELDPDPRATGLIAGRARAIADSLLTGIRIHRDGCRNPHDLKGLDHAG